MLGKLYWFQKGRSLGGGMLKSRWIKAVRSYMEITDCLEDDEYWKDLAARNRVCSDKFVYRRGLGQDLEWWWSEVICY